MSYLLFRKDFNCDYDNSITCPICNNNQLIYQGSELINGEKIKTTFKCITCREKEYSLVLKSNNEKNTTEIFWEYNDGGFYKVYFN